MQKQVRLFSSVNFYLGLKDSESESESDMKSKVTEKEEDEKEEEEEEESDEYEGVDYKPDELIFNPESHMRKWLVKHGKEHCIDFDDADLKKLRGYFSELEDDGSGAIGVDELEDPLIALGLVDSR